MQPLDPAFILRRLAWPAATAQPLDVVLDTDTYNEIDDQFALVYAELSAERIRLHAIHAAPFHNKRSTGPADGMARSFDEILRVMDTLGRSAQGRVFRGSDRWLTDTATDDPLAPEGSVASAARDDLIERARNQTDDRPLYVVAIGAITNVASAILAAPDIREKIVLLWLAGQPLDWPTAEEFNLRQDPRASRVVFDSGVPLVFFPCALVAEMIRTTVAELDAHLAGRSPIGTYLSDIFRNYESKGITLPGGSKEIWDLAPLTWLMNEAWARTTIEPSPILTSDLTWSADHRRHPIRVARQLRRDPVFADLFAKAATSA